jgi:CDGSH-type Zn-finger protein/uncharacterized Fe-S cluster protein YjdI
MSDPHVFPNPAITVTWSKRRCIHSADCIAGLPDVFMPGRKPWITPEDATADEIARVIARCPSGALQFERLDGGAAETPDPECVIRVARHGPLYLRGSLEIAIGGGAVSHETRVALCRCGQSRNKPFCDNSHRDARFRDAGEVFEGRIEPPLEGEATLRVTAREDGPLKLTGSFTIVSDDGRVRITAGDAALCRCGQSKNKPFCDSTHKTSGFTAPALEAGGP